MCYVSEKIGLVLGATLAVFVGSMPRAARSYVGAGVQEAFDEVDKGGLPLGGP